MTTESLISKLYSQIETELSFCDSAATPFICSQFGDLDTRSTIVKTIAETCVSMKITIAQAIVQVERTYNPNMLD